MQNLAPQGYVIRRQRVEGQPAIVIAANDDVGVLYGVFHFLRLLQTQQPLDKFDVSESSRVQLRMLNHWDNLDRNVERGYAGASLWDWHKLPDYLDPRYTDYARANASLGINATVLTNVNANATSLTPMYLEKAAALANVFRPYGIRVFLTARFSAPVEIGGLKTADPLDPQVQRWWQAKAAEIYKYIPDFGGFLVKANSEGQPGPQDYGRTHADGANMLADALKPHGGIVIWRAFVYSHEQPDDRAKQAYDEFVPLDGKFRDNVLVQVKNGAIDFQPREPFHPLFGAMPKTPLAMEFQITKEYLGFATHLVYLGALLEEVLRADTYRPRKGSTVAKIVDGSAAQLLRTRRSPAWRTRARIATGAARISIKRTGTRSVVWRGIPMLSSQGHRRGMGAHDVLERSEVRREHCRHDDEVARSRRGLHDAARLASLDGSRSSLRPRAMGRRWTARRLDIGVLPSRRRERHRLRSHARPAATRLPSTRRKSPRSSADLKHVPEEYLLWFHHVPWDYRTQSGRILWDELVYRYTRGVDLVREMEQTWQGLSPYVDAERHAQVAAFLRIQEKEAKWWRDASIAYFQQFSKRPLPAGFAAPEHSLDYYKSLEFPYAPGHH